MSILDFPLQFRRQYQGPLDPDSSFATTAERIAYLNNPIRYAGQVVYDREADQHFALNAARDAYVPIGEEAFKIVKAFPATGEEGAVYINTATQEAKMWNNGAYINPFGTPLTPTAPTEYLVPVTFMLGFNTSLDETNEVVLDFAAKINFLEWTPDPNKVIGTTFSTVTRAGTNAADHTTTADLQAWIDDFGAAGFLLTIQITPEPSYSGEITVGFTYHKTISVPTIRETSGGTGWAQYKDTQYTQAAPFRLLAGQEMTLPNNAGSKIESQLPSGVSFYDPVTQKFTPENIGDGYNFQINFQATPTVGGSSLLVAIDIGGTIGNIFPVSYQINADAGVETPVFIPIPGGYSGDTFKANGGQVKVTASHDVDVYDTLYIPSRYHKAR